MPFYSISELADEIGCPPKMISDLFFRRVLDPSRCTIKAGRRLIPEDYVTHVKRALRQRGH